MAHYRLTFEAARLDELYIHKWNFAYIPEEEWLTYTREGGEVEVYSEYLTRRHQEKEGLRPIRNIRLYRQVNKPQWKEVFDA